MQKTPLIFLSFANDPDDHLKLLKQESRNLYAALEELDRKEHIKIHREESARISDIFDAFVRNKDRIAIFHYGGHAKGTHLLLEEGMGDARGLATLLGEQENLKLVFLNGCSTKGQVKALLDAGVKAVIATSVPVADNKALEFSRQFYEALAQKRTIGQAFKIAQAYLKTHHGDTINVQYRALHFEFEETDTAQKEIEEMPWGLYLKEEYEQEVLNWKMPYYRAVGLPQDMLNYIGKSFTANRYIVLILNELCKYNPNIYAQMMEQRNGELVKKDSRHYPGLIIQNFPWPIGSQIRLLRLYDQPNLERVEQLLSTYIMTSQVVYYILLSNLWENERCEKVGIRWDKLNLDKANFKTFDFFAHTLPLYNMVMGCGLSFVSEMEILATAIHQENSPLNKAHQYLETIRQQFNAGEFPTADMEKNCLKIEQALSIFLQHVAFLAAYRMLTVRNISVDRPRFENLAYDLEMGPLNAAQGIDLNLYQDAAHRRKTSFADSASVILVANENRLDQALNLSPFIMDKNTFVQMKKSETTEKDRLAHIFMLGWSEGERLYYTAVEHSFFAALATESDQIHTDMTLEDFTEGRNLSDDSANDFDFDFGFANGQTADVVADVSPRVFELFKQQFEMIRADLAT